MKEKEKKTRIVRKRGGRNKRRKEKNENIRRVIHYLLSAKFTNEGERGGER